MNGSCCCLFGYAEGNFTRFLSEEIFCWFLLVNDEGLNGLPAQFFGQAQAQNDEREEKL